MGTKDGEGVFGDVPLYLVDAAKAMDVAPNGIAIGLITLRGWQVHRLSPMTRQFAGRTLFLVRVNYDFDVDPEAPEPSWAQVEFRFPEPDVLVVDAIPRRVTAAVEAGLYELSGQLNFLPRAPGTAGRWLDGPAPTDIVLPALTPRIDCFGLGGHVVRWRHSGSAPVGAHAGWLVLEVPENYELLSVVAAGQYQVATDPSLRLRPSSRNDAFVLKLPPAGPDPSSDGAHVAEVGLVRRGVGPRVFVSYAQESASHKHDVTQLCRLLQDHRVDVHFDQQGLDTRRTWEDWINTQILRSDFVIVIASPEYRAVGDGEISDDRRLGVRSEYLRLADLLHRHRNEWTRRILPVVLPGRSPEEIPLGFLPGIGDYYRLDDFSAAGVADLLRVLRRDQAPG